MSNVHNHNYYEPMKHLLQDVMSTTTSTSKLLVSANNL